MRCGLLNQQLHLILDTKRFLTGFSLIRNFRVIRKVSTSQFVTNSAHDCQSSFIQYLGLWTVVSYCKIGMFSLNEI